MNNLQLVMEHVTNRKWCIETRPAGLFDSYRVLIEQSSENGKWCPSSQIASPQVYPDVVVLPVCTLEREMDSSCSWNASWLVSWHVQWTKGNWHNASGKVEHKESHIFRSRLLRCVCVCFQRAHKKLLRPREQMMTDWCKSFVVVAYFFCEASQMVQ